MCTSSISLPSLPCRFRVANFICMFLAKLFLLEVAASVGVGFVYLMKPRATGGYLNEIPVL